MGLAAALRQHEKPDMICPFCETPMVAGNLEVRGPGWGFLLFGWSYQHCWFAPEEGPDEMFVSNKLSRQAKHPDCGAFRAAYKCQACRTVVAPGEDAHERAPVE